ncbi:MAG TPA: aminotransferase class I/II-fold pyridoxal phosphate-dependent enzyme, partial [Candidatus Binataceae bacterium]|nr:aminotransferase class I/II-fold pyridoxal phosphate-dependent enzyme [Candidatus Binataceae bacterium]
MNVTAHRYQIEGKSGNRISASIEEHIRNGRLVAGSLLPPIRALAEHLQVSPTTVAAAYRALRVRGLVRAGGRRGTIVNRRPPLATPALPASPAGAINLADGNPDPELLPPLHPILAKLAAQHQLYGGETNRPRLIEMARHSFIRDRIPARDIAVVSGAMDGIERVLQAHLSPGDVAAVEDPSYNGVSDLIAALGMIAEPVALDQFGMRPDSLATAIRADAKAVIITPRAQNPTGVALDKRRAAELRAVLAKSSDTLLIEDDFGGLVSGAPALTVADAHMPRWAVIRSVSKALGPDLRVALVAGDDLTMARVEGRQRLGPRWVSHILQDAVVAMWSEAKTMRIVQRAADTYTERRQALMDEFAKVGIKAQGSSGLNVWIPVADENAIVQSLLEDGWAVRAGANYRIGSAPGLRVTIS